VAVSIEELQQGSALSGTNASFVEELYESWLADPASVGEHWRRYFDGLGARDDRPHSPVVERIGQISRLNPAARITSPAAGPAAAKQSGAMKLINAYRSRGHVAAPLDPLGLWQRPAVPDLEPAFHGLGPEDLEVEFDVSNLIGSKTRKLKDLLPMLKSTYCGGIGAEYMHITEIEQRRFFQEQLESKAGRYGLDAAKKRRILAKLSQAEGLEVYLHTKYVGQKRFSLEGGDSLIPLVDELVQRAGSIGIKDVVMGMAHRGRLNVLVNVLGKPARELFDVFEGKHDTRDDDPAHSGDVKYHLGFSSDVQTPGGPVHLTLGFNPSHLEIIDPVIAGSVRARQARRKDGERTQALPVLIHGDAAFAGQGVVMELFNMSQARGYTVGGTVHIVVNNQVGFTTSKPEDVRSTMYCTDVAKIIGAPILHVNGDDPEAVVFCAQVALDYRMRFKRDVVIDLVCYRRHGHNEADEPAATQPLMYQVIRARKRIRQLYAEKLVGEGVIDAAPAQALLDGYKAALDANQPVVEELLPEQKHAYITDWTPYVGGRWTDAAPTGLLAERIATLCRTLFTLPDGLKLHSRVAKIYDDRLKMAAGEIRMDWGFAETLAYAALLEEGYPLRLSGQDAGRGTFFHRHAVLHDQQTGESHVPLRQLSKRADQCVIIDSVLSEEAVMAFEYGYALSAPDTLVIWEAQFGDFCNGAQVVIDQFISSGEAKWGRLCGLVLFLPHGYEGQGPEHSSARLERFMQLCALENMQVCVPTTPAQMFHMLRRQMLRKFRKPLVVMTPKSMLRNPASTSTLADLEHGQFQLVIGDSLAADPAMVRRIVLCSGKVYYDVAAEHTKRGVRDVALVRIEQLYPFPRAEVRAELERYPNARELVWCQEEPQNQGAWYQIRHHLDIVSQGLTLSYAGRPRSPAPACGHTSTHNLEQAALINDALGSGATPTKD